MGTRAYPDDAPPKKKERAILKSKETTSAALGFRVCGLQVWIAKNANTSVIIILFEGLLFFKVTAMSV
jgi:hypothetical protein